MTPLEFIGLRGNHPLGFLSACGVLRCCSGEGKCEATLHWKEADDGSGPYAVLGAPALSSDCLIELLIKRAEGQADCQALSWSDKIDDKAKFTRLGIDVTDNAASSANETADWLPALSSDIIENAGKLQRTSMDLTSGNQQLLKSLRGVAAEISRKTTKKGQAPLAAGAAALREALYGPWRYADETHSLGWDPQSQRLHALRNKIPEKDKQRRSVRGAVFLASLALPLFPSFAVRGKLRTTGFQMSEGEDWFAWPIWREPVSLFTLRSLLGQPLESMAKRRGITAAFRCARAHTGGADGDYRVFGNAEQLLLE